MEIGRHHQRSSTDPVADGRFERFSLISWWYQERLRRARVVVVGAGAIGNEVLKNLALLGVGRLVVIDLDRIEHANLARSVLFRAADHGRHKAEVAAERIREIYEPALVQPLVADIVHDVGGGLFRWADVIVAGLDNREARMAVNLMAARAGRPWIDGAIERLSGVVRMFDAETGPCYECTMGELDRRVLAQRRSCALLTREELETGHVPTTPTTASVIAGMEVQELVKYLHGLPTLTGSGFVFDGEAHESYVVRYARDPECQAHDRLPGTPTAVAGVGSVRARDLLDQAEAALGPGVVIDLGRDLVSALTCPGCNVESATFGSLARLREAEARCAGCGAVRVPRFYSTIDRSSPLLDHTLADLGVPRWDLVSGRKGDATVVFECAGDANEVLGPCGTFDDRADARKERS